MPVLACRSIAGFQLSTEAEWHRDVVDRAEPIGPASRAIPVARVPDLILLKLYAGGPQDAWDILQLVGHLPDPLTVAEVERGLSLLPPDARDLWRRIRSG